MENLDLDIMPPLIPADDEESAMGILFLLGFADESCMGNNVQLHYAEYDEINNIDDDQDSSKTLVPKINHPSFENRFNNDIMIGSCNGLVCFSVPHCCIDDPVYICNPFTREYVNLPKSINQKGIMVSGFGYHHSTDEYKVVRIYYPNQHSVGRVEVYTLGSGCGWRNIGEIPYALSISSGTLANGALHWLDYKEWNIVAFDLADEEFRLLPSPCLPCFHSGGKPTAFYQLQVLDGCLCVVHHERGERLDIWSLKQAGYLQSLNWSKEFSIASECLNNDGDYEPFAITKSNEIMLWYNGTILFRYDSKTETLKKLMGYDDMGIEYLQVILHMNSSVSLKALGENSKYLEDEDI